MKNHWFSYVFHYFHKLLKMHRNPPKMLPTWSLEASKTSQNTPKRPPRRPKMAPKRHQDAPSSTQDAPSSTQEAPSSTQDAPKTSPRRPRCLQERPRCLQERPRSPQVASRTSHCSPKPLCSSIFGGFGPTHLNKKSSNMVSPILIYLMSIP